MSARRGRRPSCRTSQGRWRAGWVTDTRPRSRFVHAFTSAYAVIGGRDGGTERDERTAVRPGRQRSRPTRYRSGLTRPVRVVRQAARSHMSEQYGFPDLPEATVARLPEYLRALHNLADGGHDTV